VEQVEGERAEKERKITFPSDSLLSVFSLRPSFDVAVALFLFFFRVSFSPAGNVRRPSCLDAAMAGRGEEPCGMLNHRVSHLCGKGRERASERERDTIGRLSLFDLEMTIARPLLLFFAECSNALSSRKRS